MGWTYQRITQEPKAFLDAEYAGWTGDGQTVRRIASAMVGSTYYAAMERVTHGGANRSVFALVCITEGSPLGFGHKPMHEQEGPRAATCPADIMQLLTPTESYYALAWRERCRANLIGEPQ